MPARDGTNVAHERRCASPQQLLGELSEHRPRLVASLVPMVGHAEAEELANETLMRALAAMESFRGEAALGTWLQRIAINLAYDALRRRKHDPLAQALPEEALPDVAIDTADGAALERGQMSLCVQRVLAKLPARERDLLMQADVLDRTAPEMAAASGISTGNAKIRLHRARQAAKALLEEHCDFHHEDVGILCCTPKTMATVSMSMPDSSKAGTDPVPHMEPDHAG